MSLDLLDLPVWTIRPNWANGIVERLEWLSSVHASSSSGSEQRQALRLSPRRSFEITSNPIKRERAYADLFLHRMAAQEMLFPLWHDQGNLASDLEAGDTDLVFDNTFREHAVGECAILYKDAFAWEVIYIDAASDTGLTAADPVGADWPKGTLVYPLRAARLTADSNFSALTGTVGETQLLFTLSRQNDFEEEDTFDLTYAGLPVILQPPNRSEALDQSFQRLLAELDNETGVRRVLDLPGRSFVTQVHGWFCRGREEHYNIRKLLYYLRGRTRAVWFPTFNDDVVTARDSLTGSSLLDIEMMGYDYTGGAIDGRKQLLLKDDTTYEVASIDSVGAPLAPDEERLVLEAPLGIDILAGQAFSFIDTMRLDQDTIEITHHGDSDGVCEVAGAFRSFRNARDETAPAVNAIPDAEMSSDACGSAGFIFNNLGFEDGTAYWSGVIVIIQTPVPPLFVDVYEGLRYAAPGNNAYSEFYQQCSIPSDLHGVVDAGGVTLTNLSAWHATFGPQTDHGRWFVSFRDSIGDEISAVYSADHNNPVWTELTIPDTVLPVGTRAVRIGTQNTRDEGTFNDNYWDSFSQPTLVV